MSIVDLRSQAIRRTASEMLTHLNVFTLEPKISAGIWYMSPSDSRFHAKYKPDLSIEQRMDIASSLTDYGLSGIEAHYPNEINEENADLWRKFTSDTGIRLITVIPLLFRDPIFEWGSLSNPEESVRARAIDITKGALRMNKEFDTDFSVVWPGIDGYENPFGIDFASMRDRFIDGLAEVMDDVPGVRIAFEPKPYEPRGHILFGTTAEGMLLCHAVEEKLSNQENTALLLQGHKLCCMNPEIGHVLMGYEDLPYAYSWPLSEGRLAHMHINSQPLGNYDQDLNIGVVHPEQFEALMYTLKMYGYDGYFGIDINPERIPVDVALRINIDAVRAAADRVNNLDHESIIEAVNNPSRTRGWLEAYLIRVRASNPGLLPELPRPKKIDK